MWRPILLSQTYVFFDVDDTLVEWTVRWEKVFAQAAREAGAEVSDQQAWDAINTAFSTFYDDYLKKHSEAGDEQEFWLDYNGRILETLGVRSEPGRAAARVTELLKKPDAIRLFPEVQEVLQTLSEKGARLGILTGRPRAAPDLEALGVGHYFGVVLDALSAGETKGMGSVMFGRAAGVAAAAGMTAWHIGDSYEHDVEAAQAAGLRAVLVDRDGRHEEADCPRIEDLRALPEMIAEDMKGVPR